MTASPDEILIRYASAAEPIRALKQLRRFGLRAPRDHVIVEGALVVLVLIPVALFWAEVILFDQAIAAYAGYFALRWFNMLVKPRLLVRFGPRFGASEATSTLTMTFGPEGVISESENSAVTLNWRAIPAAAEAFAKGVVLRIAPEQSLVVTADRLPDGMTPVAFAARLETWRASV